MSDDAWTYCCECERELKTVSGGAFCGRCFDRQDVEINSLRQRVADLEAKVERLEMANDVLRTTIHDVY